MALHLPENLKKIADAIAANNAKNELKIHRLMGHMIYRGNEEEQDKWGKVNEQPEQHSQDKKTEESNNSDK